MQNNQTPTIKVKITIWAQQFSGFSEVCRLSNLFHMFGMDFNITSRNYSSKQDNMCHAQ